MGPSATRSSSGASQGMSRSATSSSMSGSSVTKSVSQSSRVAGSSSGSQSSGASSTQHLASRQVNNVRSQAQQQKPGSLSARADASVRNATAQNLSRPVKVAGNPSAANTSAAKKSNQSTGKSLPSVPQAAGYAGMARNAKPIVPPGAGSSWVIRKVDVNPASSSPKATMGAQGNPLRVGMQPNNVSGATSSAQHSLNINSNQSPYLSTSRKPYGAPNFSAKATAQSAAGGGLQPSGLKRSQPYMVDLNKVTGKGGSVVSTNQLVRDLNNFAKANPDYKGPVSKLKQTVSRIEGETLIKGSVSKDAISVPNKQHLNMIRKAEDIYSKAKAGGGTAEQVIKRAQPELRALETATEASSKFGSNLSRAGKGLGVLGAAASVYELGKAGKESVDTGSPAPVAAEAVRQVGGWAGAWAGAQAGAGIGALAGIETGPGAVLTGLAGGIIGGVAGFFAADKAADLIHEN
jgi:hypothetical protein